MTYPQKNQNKSLKTSQKWMSRNIFVDGIRQKLSVVTLSCDGKIEVQPFIQETEGVIYTDKTIEISTDTIPNSIKFL